MVSHRQVPVWQGKETSFTERRWTLTGRVAVTKSLWLFIG